MTMPRDAQQRFFTITEDGEAIGTLQQFAYTLNVPRKAVVSCIQDEVPGTLVLEPGSGQDHIVIANKDHLSGLRSCAGRSQPGVSAT